MALKEYKVEISGVPHTLQLSDEDAKRYENAEPVKSAAPANKQAAPQNK